MSRDLEIISRLFPFLYNFLTISIYTVKDTVKLSDSQERILEEIKKNSYITQTKLSEVIGINLRNIKSNMKKFQFSGLIERDGTDKVGKWRIIHK